MTLSVARSELILGGQKSGKSRRAEALAAQWLAASPAHRALLIATAEAHDEEMRQRIARHQSDRAARVPRMQTLEEPRDLARVLVQRGAPDTLIVVDCLTLWLTHWMFGFDENLMQKEALGGCRTWSVESENRPQRGQFLPDLQPHSPAMGQKDGEKWTAAADLQPTISTSDSLLSHNWPAQAALFFEALAKTPGPVVLVGNEIGLGVIPLGSQVRAFVDALGLLNQQAAQACARATLMVSGLPLTLKDTP